MYFCAIDIFLCAHINKNHSIKKPQQCNYYNIFVSLNLKCKIFRERSN